MQAEDVGQQTRVLELAVRHVDAHVDGPVEENLPLRDLAAHIIDDPAAERNDQADLLHVRQELHRAYQAATRMIPSNERFEPIDAFRIEPHDGLVIDLVLVAIHGLTDLGLQLQPGDGGRTHGHVEECIRTSAIRLGVVHRDVGVPQHVLGIGVPVLAGRDPDARGHGDTMPVDVDRGGQAGLHPLDDRSDRARLRDCGAAARTRPHRTAPRCPPDGVRPGAAAPT